MVDGDYSASGVDGLAVVDGIDWDDKIGEVFDDRLSFLVVLFFFLIGFGFTLSLIFLDELGFAHD